MKKVFWILCGLTLLSPAASFAIEFKGKISVRAENTTHDLRGSDTEIGTFYVTQSRARTVQKVKVYLFGWIPVGGSSVQKDTVTDYSPNETASYDQTVKFEPMGSKLLIGVDGHFSNETEGLPPTPFSFQYEGQFIEGSWKDFQAGQNVKIGPTSEGRATYEREVASFYSRILATSMEMGLRQGGSTRVKVRSTDVISVKFNGPLTYIGNASSMAASIPNMNLKAKMILTD